MKKWLRGLSISIIVLGSLHNLFTFYITRYYESVGSMYQKIFVEMFLGTGTAVILFGILSLKAIKLLPDKPAEAIFIIRCSGGFVSLVGLGAIWITPWNPMAYLVLLNGALIIIIIRES
ncbi:hypothetical protein Q9251_21650 [Alkalihalobacillus macyae]|uniref:hypothetical protein n=1 Tax=Guptibacillus hwajinpoensis TaxID=208199 RepID=UPI00273BC02E|nr:hypothetical protein [Alkalihalobacillus macyae]MDP4553462.1 hypothetical protein [Alkalihalobacillus macyae]